MEKEKEVTDELVEKILRLHHEKVKESAQARLEQYHTYNPKFTIIHIFRFDCERYLHVKFKDKRVLKEWFLLSQEDVQWIISNKEELKKHRVDEPSDRDHGPIKIRLRRMKDISKKEEPKVSIEKLKDFYDKKSS